MCAFTSLQSLWKGRVSSALFTIVPLPDTQCLNVLVNNGASLSKNTEANGPLVGSESYHTSRNPGLPSFNSANLHVKMPLVSLQMADATQLCLSSYPLNKQEG